MWVRKENNENITVDDERNWGFKTPLIVSFVASCGSLVWEQTLDMFLIIYVVSFLLSYLGQVLFHDPLIIVGWIFSGSWASSKNLNGICNKCHQLKPISENRDCSCGGKIEPIKNWKWIDNS
jgi:hypothetical protein